MRWNGKYMRRITGAAAAASVIGLAAVLSSGCGVQTSVRETESAPMPQTAPESSPQETTQEQTEEQTQGETIAPLPSTEAQEEEKGEGKRMILMTDIHYLSQSLTDGGESFTRMVEHGDGKLVHYVEEITDAALDEVVNQKPDVLILAGDLTLEGEKESHEDLAKKLEQVEEAGIPVVVIPGNHDINNTRAAGYREDEIYPAGSITAEEFEEIYGSFGYEESYSRDSFSLSYTYDLDDQFRLLMLDTCQYDPVNLVGGMIDTETYDWIEQQLDEAFDEGKTLLPVAHHNLLDQSEIYVGDCTIEHSGQLIDLLENHDVRLFLSGHLHVQHWLQHDDIGIYEAVTSSLATPPCQYGVLDLEKNGDFRYWTQSVDMESWAAKNQLEDENLLSFDTYSPPTLKRIFYNQAYDAMKDSREEEPSSTFVKLTQEQKDAMSQVYADLNAACYGGRAVEIVEQAKESQGFAMWEGVGYPPRRYQYLEYIVKDAVKNYNTLESD